MTDPLLVRDDGGVRTLTLHRPDALNAMTEDLFDLLREAVIAAALDRRVRCLVLTGAGRAFCAGLDLHDFEPARRQEDGQRHGFVPCIEEIERFPKPLVAAVNGLAVGFGATVLLHCDLAVASTSSRFRFPFVHLGLGPEAGSSYLLPQRIGAAEAAYVLFTGDWVEAETARALGLVWRTVEPEELEPEVLRVAARIAEGPLESLVATKKNLLASRLGLIRSARERELESYARLLDGDAHRQAIARFRASSP